jgi:hypothetical protein
MALMDARDPIVLSVDVAAAPAGAAWRQVFGVV